MDKPLFVFSREGVVCKCGGDSFTIHYVVSRDRTIQPAATYCNACNNESRSSAAINKLEGAMLKDLGEIPATHGKMAEAVRKTMRKCIFETQVIKG